MWTLSLIILCGWYTTATSIGDCGVVSNISDVTDVKAYQILTEQYKGTNIEWAMPAAAISIALTHLKQACCKSQYTDKQLYCDNFLDKENYPDSIYLYDQLLDIGLRRLDGNRDLAYNLEPEELDSKGKDRRTFITAAAEEKNGTGSQAILDRRNTDRTRNKIYIDDRNGFRFKDAIDNYQKQTLADRYYNMCNTIEYIYTQLNQGNSVNTISLTKCQDLVNRRISDENMYTKIIIIKKSNELLHKTLEAYTQKYFVQEKMMVLMTLVNKVKSLYSTMIQQAAVSKTCSK
jgi:hypothetical protein